ncbi:MAG TPA: hypothetical protein VMP68_01265 [Candidatus Eisenbacteria bacterium]|nr:hypothetical protein [Candidatus Eisenbacteria bacterium]
MDRSAFRGLVSCVLVVLFPLGLFAADLNPAMLYTNGAAWVNGSHVPRPSLAIFSGDLLQTRYDSLVDIKQPGSTVAVFGDSLVKFLGNSVEVDHGGVSVSTAKQLATTVGDIRVTPASEAWTEFTVIDVDGTVKITAKKGELTLSDGTQTATLAEGQQTTRDDTPADNSDNSKGKKKSSKQQSGASPAAKGPHLNAPLAIGLAGGAVIGLTTWVLLQSSNPASPSKPN